jgi:hypothetical protein
MLQSEAAQMPPRILLWRSIVFVNPDLLNQVGPLLLKAGAGLVITGLLGAIVWPFRKMKSEWIDMKKEQACIHSELVQQRENHLTHIEMYSNDQVTLLNKVCDVLEGVRLDLREQTTILRMPCPRLRTRVAKK